MTIQPLLNYRRVYVVCEGQTEEAIAKQTLGPHLETHRITLVPWVVKTKRPAGGAAHRGGGRWTHYKREIKQALADRSAAAVTTMIDLYGYPTDGPGLPSPKGLRDLALAGHLEGAMGSEVSDLRFLPHLQVHEIEALLLAAPDAVGDRAGDPSVGAALSAAVGSCGGAELVDQGPTTHPSARIKAAWPRFAKTSDGPSLVAAVGLPTIRAACPHFDRWLGAIERL